MHDKNIERLAIEGKVEEERARGRQRLTYMDGLSSVVAGNLKGSEIFHAAQDKEMFQNTVANVRIQQGTPRRSRYITKFFDKSLL